MKRILACVLALMLALCAAAVAEDVTITYMASQDWVQDAEMELGEKFTEQTGIKVDYQIIPSDQYTNLLMSKLNSGECADLFGSQAGQFDIVTQLNVEKNAVDLSGEAWAATVDPLAAAETSVNGKLYGQPAQDVSAVWAVAYNKKVFEKLNLAVPTNYEEFKAVCEAIKADGMVPVYEAVSDGWHHQLWFCELGVAIEHAEPGTAEKLNNNEMGFADSATAKQLVDQIKEMVDLGYWGDNYMANAYADAARAIAEGECAMTVANQGFPTEINAAYPEFPAEDIGFFVMPLCDNQVLNMNPVGPTRFIYSGSDKIDAAKQYLAFLAEPENIQYQIEKVSKFNTLPFTTAKDAYSPEISAFYAAYPEHGTVYQTSVNYVNPQWMEIGKELVAVLQGDQSADDMLKNIDRNRADQATAAKDPAWN
ncbi:MAG: carbohydrate ABC transporter substrate-binding protein [Clostridia bacterium]|nr:carbohydrate ABC transporter substrate-binding protein [Clostridia bacterium]